MWVFKLSQIRMTGATARSGDFPGARMSDQPIQRPASRRQAAARRILGEAVLVTAAGIIFALAANQVSPLGLKLGRNYFPGGMARPAGAAIHRRRFDQPGRGRERPARLHRPTAGRPDEGAGAATD